jgi:hypothetical protein
MANGKLELRIHGKMGSKEADFPALAIGEGIITALTVSAVLASRSDLVYGWDKKNTTLEIRS